MKYKIKWKVSEKATGRFKGFSKRAWPTAYYQLEDDSEIFCASLHSKDEYRPSDVNTGNHFPINLWVAAHATEEERKLTGCASWRMYKLRYDYLYLKEAKDALLDYIKNNPSIKPECLRGQ